MAIIAAIVGFCIGTDAGAKSAWKRINEMDTHKRIDLTKLTGTIKIPHHYLTRYVRMDKEDMHSTNDNIEVLEDDGFTVDDYDTDDGIITMTKGVYEPDPLPTSAKVFIVVEVFTGQDERIIGCFATEEEVDAFIRSYNAPNSTLTCEEWEIGETVSTEP